MAALTSNQLIAPHALPTIRLSIEEIPANDEIRLVLKSLSNAWMKIADHKLSYARTDLERRVFWAARKVNLVVFQRAKRVTNFQKVFTVVTCTGSDNTILAYALIKTIVLPLEIGGKSDGIRPFIHLNYLATDPENLCSHSRIPGLGSSLIDYLKIKSLRDQFLGIIVEPLDQAESFFERHGFIRISDSGDDKVTMCWKPLADASNV